MPVFPSSLAPDQLELGEEPDELFIMCVEMWGNSDANARPVIAEEPATVELPGRAPRPLEVEDHAPAPFWSPG